MSDIHRAADLHRAGRLDEAAVLCRQILVRDPNHSDALNSLGYVYAEVDFGAGAGLG